MRTRVQCPTWNFARLFAEGQERTHAGLAIARARGKKGGRTPRHAEEPRVRMAYTMYVEQSLSVRDICRVLRICQATFYRYVAFGRRVAETT
jgi:DNA invertase Pin-like site-specific DNA recombinase